MKIKIKVTKDILERAKNCGSIFCDDTAKNCAIALAVRDIFPNAVVGSDTMCLNGDTSSLVLLPENAKFFIMMFDAYVESPKIRTLMHELEFEITIPENIIDSINIEDIQNSKTLELV